MSLRKLIRTFYAKHRHVNWSKYDYQSDNCEVIVSMSLMPNRLPTMKSLIMSLLQQSHRPDWIEVHVAKKNLKGEENHWDIPAWLQSLKAVKLIWHDVDLGPALKFIPAVVRNYESNPLIVIADDDVLLDRNLIKQYLGAYKTIDHNAVIGSRGWRIDPSMAWDLSPVLEAIEGVPQRVGVITGVGTYCLRPKFFDIEALQDFSVLKDKSARAMDDVWISGHLSRKNIPKYTIYFPRRPYQLLGYFRYPSEITEDDAERKRSNDIILKHFKSDWKEEELMSDSGN